MQGADLTGARFYLVDDRHTFAEKPAVGFENGRLEILLERNSILYIEKN